MALVVEALAADAIEWQAPALTDFANCEAERLGADESWLFQRYRDEITAVESIRKTLERDYAREFMLRDGDTAQGWARITAAQRIGNPSHFFQSLRPLRGDRIEYVSSSEVDEAEHVVVTLALLRHAASRRVLAVQNEQDADVAPGIAQVMQAVGAPTRRLYIANGSKGFGLHGKPGPLQVYMHQKAKAVQ